MIDALGTQEITRVRMGIGAGSSGGRWRTVRAVAVQEVAVSGHRDQVLDSAADAVRVILTEGVQAAMNRFNRKPETDEAAAANE